MYVTRINGDVYGFEWIVNQLVPTGRVTIFPYFTDLNEVARPHSKLYPLIYLD